VAAEEVQVARPLDKVRALLDSMIHNRRKELLAVHEGMSRSFGWHHVPLPEAADVGAPTPLTVVCAWCGEIIVSGAEQAGETHSICPPCFERLVDHQNHGAVPPLPAGRAEAHSHYFGELFGGR
jgi:hypothetical protein